MNFTESVVEDAALAWLESVDYAINAILVVVRERSVSFNCKPLAANDKRRST